MVDNFQKKSFLRSSEGAIASYDWYDFASGLAYKTFYAVGGYNSVGKTYFLASSAIPSDVSNNSTGNLGAGTHEYDFDTTFTRPATIASGEAYFRITYSSTSAVNVYAIITIYHVTSGGTETSIGTVTTKTINNVLNTSCIVNFAVNKTSFKIGEKLRLNVQLVSGGNFGIFIYQPTSSGYETYVTLPFETDL